MLLKVVMVAYLLSIYRLQKVMPSREKMKGQTLKGIGYDDIHDSDS